MAQAMPVIYGMQAINSISSAYSESQAARAEGDYQKKIFEMNARISDIQAADALRRGQDEGNAARFKSRSLQAKQRMAAAAQGLDIGVGAPADLIRDEQLMSELDTVKIKNNAKREAFGYKVASLDARSRGEMAAKQGRRRGRQTLLTGGLNAATDLMKAGYSASNRGGGMRTPTRGTGDYAEPGTYTG